MRILLSTTCFSVLLSGCATKIVREYYTTPERVVYIEPIVQKAKGASPIPIWTVVVITFIVSFLLFMIINVFTGRRKP